MGRRWVKRVTGLMLTLAMILAGIGPWSGGLCVSAADTTNLFQNTSEADWTLTASNATMTYDNGELTITELEGNGETVVLCQSVTLESGSTPVCYVKAKETSNTDDVWVHAYDNAQWDSLGKATADGAELTWTAYNTGDIGWSIWLPGGAVLVLSGMSLTVSGEDASGAEESEYTVSISADSETVEAGNSITLTAEVKKDGTSVTDLEDAGLHLYWWNNTEDSDSWFVNYDGTNGYALTLDVSPQSAGTYEIQAKLENATWAELCIQKYTLIVEPSSGTVDGDLNITKVANLDEDFIMGMDISSVISEFESGVTYKDYDGNTINNLTDFCKFLAENGVTHIRVRVWNDPYDSDGNGYGGGNSDVEKAKTIADACREAELKMLVDFHCSDLWTDPSKQMVPKAWTKYTLEEKEEALESYITTSLNTIDPQQDVVDMVQVGNETTGGFIGETDVVNMCTLFSAGACGVRTYNNAVKIVIHVESPQKGSMETWAKNLSENQVDYDILGTSYYPYWHGTLDNLKSQMQSVRTTYEKNVMVVETSYAYTLEDSDGHDNTVRVGNNDTGDDTTEPFTEQGQATAIRNLIAAVNEAGGLGVFYWEPAWITVGDTTGLTGSDYDERVAANKVLWEQYGSGWASSYAGEYDAEDAGKWYGSSAVDNEAMFYPDGTPTAALHVWNYVKTGATTTKVSVESLGVLNSSIYVGDSFTLPTTLSVTYNSGKAEESVTWSTADQANIDTSKQGTYTVSGTVTFSKIIDQGAYKDEASATVTYTLTVLPKNLIMNTGDAGFESGSGENFTIGGLGISSIPSKDDPRSGSGSMHWYSTTEAQGTVTYNPTIALDVGSYVFQVYAQGYAGDQVCVQILDEADNVLYTGSPVTLEGWKDWKQPTVSFTLTQTTSIKLRIVIDMQAEGWGTADEMYLYVEEEGSGESSTDSTGTGGSSTDSTGTGGSSTGGAGTGGSSTGGAGTGDGSTGSTTDSTSTSTQTLDDGTVVVTTATVNADGTVTTVTTSTATDGSAVEKINKTVTNSAGNEVKVTTTTKTDAEGSVISVTEKSVIAQADENTTATVTVKTNAEGETTAAATVKKPGTEAASGTKGVVSGKAAAQITEAAGTSDVMITQKVLNTDGTTAFTVKVNAADLAAGEVLSIVKVNTKTGEITLVNAKDYKVNAAGSVSVTMNKKGTYQLVSESEEQTITKEILKTVKVKKSTKTVSKGEKATVAMSGKLNMDNVKKITYTSTKTSVASVNKNGKVTAKKSGTTTVKAKVTLKNGATKTVKMKVKVK